MNGRQSKVEQSNRPDIEAYTYEELFQFGGRLSAIRREHERLLPYFANATTVLDIGCGRGVCLQMLREAGITPVGVDLSREAVERCRALGFRDVFHSDALTFLREHPDAYDGLICSHVIEHLPFADGKDLVQLAYETLRPGGRLAIVTPNMQDLRVGGNIFWLDPTHVRPYPLELLDAMLRAAHFRIVRCWQPLAVPNKRAIPRWALLRLLLGPYFGRPTSIIVGERPAS